MEYAKSLVPVIFTLLLFLPGCVSNNNPTPATIPSTALETQPTAIEPAPASTEAYTTTTLRETAPVATEAPPATSYVPATLESTTESLDETSSTVDDSESPNPENTMKMAYTPEPPLSGATLLKVESDGYKAQFAGYKIKSDYLFYFSEYTVKGVLIDVEKPDGSAVSTKLGYDECHGSYYDAQVDDVVLRLQSVSEDATGVHARIYAWSYKEHPVKKDPVPPAKPDPDAKLLSDVTSEDYSTEYNGYKFKIDHLQYNSDYHPFIVVLDVQKPDQTQVELVVKENRTSRVDNLNVASPFCGTVEDLGTLQTAAIWVWEGGSASTDTTPSEELYPLVYTPDKPPEGATPVDATSEGFTSFQGIGYKIDHLIFSGEYKISGMLLDIKNPDGTRTEGKLGYDVCHKTFYDLRVGDTVLRLVSAHDAGIYQAGRLYAWNYKTMPVMKEQLPFEKPNPNAWLIEGVSNEGYGTQYKGYKFRMDRFEYPSDDEYNPSEIVLDVQKPDGTETQVTVIKGSSVKVDMLNIASPFCGTAENAGTLQTASLWIW